MEFRLLDLGGGRQLARYGSLVVDRPFPAAIERPRDPTAWLAKDLRFDRGVDEWSAVGGGAAAVGAADVGAGPAAVATADVGAVPTAGASARPAVPDHWTMRHDGLTFELRPTPTGQVGFFAEQIEPWRHLRAAIEASARPVRLLNLFAYTGGATLAGAAAGAEVTHVDAARSPVAWARRNAELSGLAAAPIRWIVDDAEAFVARELRRGRRYNAIVLDPPSYGHGPRGERWTLAEHLPRLLDGCLALADGNPELILLTAHTEGLEADELAELLRAAFVRAGASSSSIDPSRFAPESLILQAESGASAPAGVLVRWSA